MKWIIATALVAALSACTLDLGQGVRYGNYGGPARQREAEPPFMIESTYHDVRWFPTHVRYAPDGSHLLVSLCHTLRPDLCRIGKYFIATKEWEILPYEDKRTYRWPVYHPDGKEIAVSTAPCDEQYRCSFDGYMLVRMSADGAAYEPVGDVIASMMSFSPDGRKLIYWRHGPLVVEGRRRAGGGTDIHEMEWHTSRERPLTQLRFTYEREGRPLFVEGDTAFAFFALKGRRFNGMHFAKTMDAPISWEGLRHLHQLWPENDPEWRTGDYRVYDVGTANRILYFANLALRRAQGDLSMLAKDPNYRESALLLRDRRDNKDVAEYSMTSTPFDAALSPDAERVAFLLGGSTISYGPLNFRFGLIGQGKSEPSYIDWPKLELKPGRHPISKN